MSQESAPNSQLGKILWRDLTVDDAPAIRDFYKAVIGWEHRDHPMDDYHDYDILQADTGEVVTGIINRRGVNATLPPVWLLYVGVEDVEESMRVCERMGGKVLVSPSSAVAHRYAVIQDPAGAIIGIMQVDGMQGEAGD